MEHITTTTESTAAAKFDRELRVSFAEKNVASARRTFNLLGGPSALARLIAADAALASLSSR